MISLLGCSWLPLLLCLPAVLPSWFPFWAALGCHCCFVSQLFSLPDFPSGLLLAATVALSPSWSPFVISLLVCSWLPLLLCLPAVLPSWFPFWAALGCHCCFVSQLFSLPDFPSGLLLSVFLISLLGWCWLPLLPCLLLSPCMISLLGCSWLPLSPSLFAFMGPFWAALGCSCCHDFPSGLSWLPLPPYLPSWFPFWAALGSLSSSLCPGNAIWGLCRRYSKSTFELFEVQRLLMPIDYSKFDKIDDSDEEPGAELWERQVLL